MDALELFAVSTAFVGLGGVVGEIWLKNRTFFADIVTDVRGFAEPSRKVAVPAVSTARTPDAPLAANDDRLPQAA